MSVHIAIDGKLQQKPGGELTFAGKPTGGELTCITSLSMDLAFEAGLTMSEVGILRILARRDASHGAKEDLLAARYQFGEDKTGGKWTFPGEVWLIDDNAGGAVIGKFEFTDGQVMSVQPEDAAGPPTETVLIHANKWSYTATRAAGAPVLLSQNPDLIPVTA